MLVSYQGVDDVPPSLATPEAVTEESTIHLLIDGHAPPLGGMPTTRR